MQIVPWAHERQRCAAPAQRPWLHFRLAERPTLVRLSTCMTHHTGSGRLLTELDALFPAGVCTVMSHSRATADPLWPAEAEFAKAFSPGRQAEFRHGRACARAALLRLAVPPAAILAGKDRAPLWPEGIVGSISHGGETAAAAVSGDGGLIALGLDLEPALELEENLWPRICRREELDHLRGLSGSPGLGVRLLFSAKEAAYKALWPVTRRFLDFHDLAVRLDPDRRSFVVSSHRGGFTTKAAARMDGRFLETGGLIATGVAIRR